MQIATLFLLFLVLCGPVCLQGQDSVQSSSQEPVVLKVAIYDSKPFGSMYEGRAEGLMVEMWEKVAARLNYRYEYELVGMETLLTGVEHGVFDIGIGAITITPAREKVVDFSHAIIASGTGVVTGVETARSSWKKKWKPILGSLLELMAILALVMFVMGTIMWLIERKHQNLGFRDDIKGLADGFWWSAVTMSTVGYGDKVPKTGLGKVLTVVYILISVVAVALFTANASSILTTAKIESHINEEDDLRRVHVGSVPLSSGAEYLDRNMITYKSYASLQEAIEGLRMEEVDAVIYNMPTLRYLQLHGYRDLLVSNHYLQKNYMGFALTPGSRIKEDVNCSILSILGEADWRETVKKYLGRDS